MARQKRGALYRHAWFLQRLLPKRREIDPETVGLFRGVVSFLFVLDEIIEKNPSVDATIHSGDGLWVFYQGARQFFIKPTQRYLLLHLFSKNALYEAIGSDRKLFRLRVQRLYAPGLWQIHIDELKWLIRYMHRNWKVVPAKSQASTQAHPRNIAGDVREAILQQFLRNGSRCPELRAGPAPTASPRRLASSSTTFCPVARAVRMAFTTFRFSVWSVTVSSGTRLCRMPGRLTERCRRRPNPLSRISIAFLTGLNKL